MLSGEKLTSGASEQLCRKYINFPVTHIKSLRIKQPINISTSGDFRKALHSPHRRTSTVFGCFLDHAFVQITFCYLSEVRGDEIGGSLVLKLFVFWIIFVLLNCRHFPSLRLHKQVRARKETVAQLTFDNDDSGQKYVHIRL